jgi:hypothetical protein
MSAKKFYSLSLSPSFSLSALLHLPTGGGVVLIKGGVGIRVTGWKNVCADSNFILFYFFNFKLSKEAIYSLLLISSKRTT